MNIAKVMMPRACAVFLKEKQSARRDWEAIPPFPLRTAEIHSAVTHQTEKNGLPSEA